MNLSKKSESGDIFDVFEPPKIATLSDLISLSEKYVLSKNIDMVSLWRIQPHLIKLEKMIGLEELKKTVLRQVLYFLQGFHLRNREGEYLNTEINGPPGSGKTTVAYIIAQIYKDLGILNNGSIKIVHKDDFMGEYMGQSGPKTRLLLESCLGGVLIYDEGHSLGSGRSDDSYAKEIADTITAFLSENKNFCFFILGYEEELSSYFFALNKGLRRRFPWRHKIGKYTFNDLSKIMLKMIEDISWSVSVNETVLEDFISKNKIYFENSGGDLETFLTKVKISHSFRVFTRPEKEKFILILEDFQNALEFVSVDIDERYLEMYS